MTPRRIWISMLVCLALAVPVHADDWKIIGTQEGITISKRDVPGSSITAFRGVGAIDAPVWKIASILLDTRRAPEWVDSLKESLVVRRLGPQRYIEYNHVAMPIIMRDRDFVSNVDIVIDPGAKMFELVYSVGEDGAAPKTHNVRGEIVAGVMKASAEADGRTMFTAEVQADPKGFIPAWVVNMFQKSWPLETFERLRKQAAKPDIAMPDAFADVLAATRAF